MLECSLIFGLGGYRGIVQLQLAEAGVGLLLIQLIRLVLILIPVIVHSFTMELLEVFTVFDIRIVETDFHIVREDEDAAQHMVVVIVPYVLKGML